MLISTLGRALALGTLLAVVVAAPALAGTPSDAATQIRQIEQSGAFTPPTPRADFTVGSSTRRPAASQARRPATSASTTPSSARSSASRARRRR